MALYEEVFQSKGAVFTIRNAGPQDAQAMLDYMGCVDRETTFLAREPGEFERGFTLEKERAYLAGCQESPGELFLLAVTAQGVVAGSSHCSFRLDRARYRHRAELALSVRQDYWRQGLGRRLMEIQENWCRSQGVEKLCLEVDTANLPAIGLYLRQGFTVEGTLRNQVKLADGSYRDLYVMGKFLDEGTAFPG